MKAITLSEVKIGNEYQLAVGLTSEHIRVFLKVKVDSTKTGKLGLRYRLVLVDPVEPGKQKTYLKLAASYSRSWYLRYI